MSSSPSCDSTSLSTLLPADAFDVRAAAAADDGDFDLFAPTTQPTETTSHLPEPELESTPNRDSSTSPAVRQSPQKGTFPNNSCLSDVSLPTTMGSTRRTLFTWPLLQNSVVDDPNVTQESEVLTTSPLLDEPTTQLLRDVGSLLEETTFHTTVTLAKLRRSKDAGVRAGRVKELRGALQQLRAQVHDARAECTLHKAEMAAAFHQVFELLQAHCSGKMAGRQRRQTGELRVIASVLLPCAANAGNVTVTPTQVRLSHALGTNAYFFDAVWVHSGLSCPPKEVAELAAGVVEGDSSVVVVVDVDLGTVLRALLLPLADMLAQTKATVSVYELCEENAVVVDLLRERGYSSGGSGGGGRRAVALNSRGVPITASIPLNQRRARALLREIFSQGTSGHTVATFAVDGQVAAASCTFVVVHTRGVPMGVLEVLNSPGVFPHGAPLLGKVLARLAQSDATQRFVVGGVDLTHELRSETLACLRHLSGLGRHQYSETFVL